MNKLSTEKRVQILSCLVEGNSLRATARMCDVAFNTVLKFVPEIGDACDEYQDKVFHDLKCQRIQCDEIWSFCYAKEKNVPEEHRGEFGYGDIWTWVALDADTKLVPSFCVGNRDAKTAKIFMDDLASRLANRVQLTTDGYKIYLQLLKMPLAVTLIMQCSLRYMNRHPPMNSANITLLMYRSGQKRISGNPEKKHISTSFVERQNLTMRMSMRRFTRLTNGFSKKVENHIHHLSLYYMYYNFCRVHKTLRVTPAMEAGLTDHVWSLEEIISLINQYTSED